MSDAIIVRSLRTDTALSSLFRREWSPLRGVSDVRIDKLEAGFPCNDFVGDSLWSIVQ